MIKLLHSVKELTIPSADELSNEFRSTAEKDDAFRFWIDNFKVLEDHVECSKRLPKESVFYVPIPKDIKLADHSELPCVRLPYPTTYMETNTEGGDFAGWLMREPSDHEIVGSFFYRQAGSPYVDCICLFSLELDERGRIKHKTTELRAKEGGSTLIINPTLPNRDATRQWASTACLLPLNMLALLHCKNVATDTHVPNQKANRKRRKKGKRPLVQYKTLRITESPVKASKSSSTGSGEKRAKHTVRGHFRDYSKGRGLFGNPKLKGIYWTGPHLSGSADAGFVVKDYEVKS